MSPSIPNARSWCPCRRFFFHPRGETDRLSGGGKPASGAESGNSPYAAGWGWREPFRPVRNMPQCVCSRVAVGALRRPLRRSPGIQNHGKMRLYFIEVPSFQE